MKIVLVVLGLGLTGSLVAADPVDFTRDIRPLLSDKCFACHGPDPTHRGAKLRLDVAGEATADRGGYRVITPGQPKASELINRITSTDATEQMPPPKSGKKLTARERTLLTQWIEQGAPYANHWAYETPKAVPVPTPKTDIPLAPIDAWILSRLQSQRLSWSPEADRVTLIRRLAFDLIGLPPTPTEVEDFLADPSPRAYEALVDRLLASPHYGERMAIDWLDLVRYADTVGYHGDQDHHASPYRDYVLDTFNRNVTFDQFTREQLAGDLLPSPGPDQLLATCYNRLLQTSHEGGVQPKEYLSIYAADRVRNVSAVWMGATIGCAQCHDHKYDPYTQRDFYSLAAFFADVDEEKHLRGGGADTVPTKRPPEQAILTRAEREKLAQIEARLKTEPDPTRQASLTRERDALQKSARLVMVTRAVTPRTIRILPRGNWLDDTGEIVTPAVPRFLGQLPGSARATRLDLANWLTDSKAGIGGLTARVFVNRLWAQFFGSGLARSLDDFGGQGDPPTHPELLDRLALDFAANWDVKQLVRQMVLSRTYRQSSVESVTLRERDPENRLFGRQARFRVRAETVRDTALAVSGLLNRTLGGASVKPYQPDGYYRHLNFPTRKYVAHTDDRQWRRGLYIHWQRQYLHPMLKAFDAPSREECTAERPRSNTPLAALVLLNDPTFLESARAMAQRGLAESGTDTDRVQSIFRQATSRAPDDTERDILLKLLAASRDRYRKDPAAAGALVHIGLTSVPKDRDAVELAAWTQVGRAILNLGEVYTRN